MDGELRAIFRRRLSEFHWNSIESASTGSGIPDCEYCAPCGQSGWIEHKQSSGWAVEIRPAQVAWLTRRARMGGRAFVAVRRRTLAGPRRGPAADELWLVNAHASPRLRAGGLKALAGGDIAYVGWGGPAKWSWSTVGLILRGVIIGNGNDVGEQAE